MAHALRVLAASTYSSQHQYITVKRLDLPLIPPSIDGTGVECLIADSLDALRPIAPEIPASFRDSAEELARRVAGGCVLSVARRKRVEGHGYEVVGYELAERGVFSALGRRMPAPADVIFSHWCEVLPACRGQRIHQQLFIARDAYFRERGGAIVVGVCAPQNRASLRALARDGAVIVDTVSRTAILRGVIVKDTPWARIARTLDVWRGRGSSPAALPALPSAQQLEVGGSV